MKLFSLFVVLFLGDFQVLFAQDDCERSSCDWVFFELEETVLGEVISHEQGTCGHRAITSITILRVKEDTIRILSSCDDCTYETGQKIYIFEGEDILPLRFMRWGVGVPVKKKRGWKKEYKKAQAQLPSRFDKLVLKTTVGNLSDKSDCERSLFKAIHHNSFQCRWTFFEIEKQLEGEIIKYQAQMQACHLIGYTSLAIIAINNNQDTIRVLDYCNAGTFEEGAKVIIEAGEYKSPISIPYTRTIEEAQETYRSNKFDSLVFRTAYGKIINRQ